MNLSCATEQKMSFRLYTTHRKPKTALGIPCCCLLKKNWINCIKSHIPAWYTVQQRASTNCVHIQMHCSIKIANWVGVSNLIYSYALTLKCSWQKRIRTQHLCNTKVLALCFVSRWWWRSIIKFAVMQSIFIHSELSELSVLGVFICVLSRIKYICSIYNRNIREVEPS